MKSNKYALTFKNRRRSGNLPRLTWHYGTEMERLVIAFFSSGEQMLNINLLEFADKHNIDRDLVIDFINVILRTRNDTAVVLARECIVPMNKDGKINLGAFALFKLITKYQSNGFAAGDKEIIDKFVTIPPGRISDMSPGRRLGR